MTNLRIRLLGGLEVVHDGAAVATLASPRLQALFAYLLLHRATPQPRRQVAFLLWPDSSESQARTNLRHLLHTLRRSVPESDRFLVVDETTIQWRADVPFDLDVDEFEHAARRASSVQEGEHAVTLYRGDLLPDCYDDWIIPERERLRQWFASALERVIAQLETQRAYSKAIEYAQRWLRYDPLREEIYRTLMRLYASQGDHAGALRAFHECATVLQRELEVEPSPATREEYERLLHLEASPLAPAAAPPLVGRVGEWEQLQTIWRAAKSGQPQWVLVTGEAGIGKTRLSEEFLHWAARQGLTCVSVCAYPDQSLAFSSAAALLRAVRLPPLDAVWLTELARLMPEITLAHPELPAPSPLTESWQLLRLYEALARALLAMQPLVLFLDDLQWCDRETLAWLPYFFRFDPSARLTLVTTLRWEDLDADHPLASLLATPTRDGQLTELALERLSQIETVELATSAAGHAFDAQSAASLYRETEGNPLFVLETARAGDPARAGLPRTMQAVIEQSFAQLSSTARELLDIAAVIGRAFTFQALARASGAGEEALVRGLDELWRRRIVREQEAHTYDFTHGKLRDVAYANTSPARRVRLHRQVAAALEALHAADPDPVASEVAAHWEYAGSPERAVPYWLRAGDAARHTYANDAAIECYRRALATARGRERISTMLKLGEVFRLIGKLADAEALSRQAVDLAGKLNDAPALAKCQATLGHALVLRAAYAEAIEVLERARECFTASGDCIGVRQTLGELGDAHARQGNYRKAWQCYQEELAIAQDLGDAQAIGEAHGHLGRVCWEQGEYDPALKHLQERVRLAQQTGDRVGEDRAIGLMGVIYWERGEPARALECHTQQSNIARDIGDRLGMNYAVSNAAVVYVSQGEYGRALENLTHALDLACEIGARNEICRHIGNMAVIYFEYGDYARARQCHAAGLALALDIGDRRRAVQQLGNIA